MAFTPYTYRTRLAANQMRAQRFDTGRTEAAQLPEPNTYIHGERRTEREREQPLLCLTLNLPLPYSSVIGDYIRSEYDQSYTRLLPHRDSHTTIYLYGALTCLPPRSRYRGSRRSLRPLHGHGGLTLWICGLHTREGGGEGEGSWGGVDTRHLCEAGEVAADFDGRGRRDIRQHDILAWTTSDEMCTALDVGKVCAGRVYEYLYTVVGWEQTQAERGVD